MTEDLADNLLRQLTDEGGANRLPQLMERRARLLASIQTIGHVF